jgi:hypothetical protein
VIIRIGASISNMTLTFDQQIQALCEKQYSQRVDAEAMDAIARKVIVLRSQMDDLM